MKKKEIYNLGKKITKGLFFISVIISCILSYKVYDFYQKYPNTHFNWLKYESPPQEFLMKAHLISDAKNFIMISLLIYFVFEIFAFLYKPEDHFFKHLVDFFNKKMKEIDKGDEEDGTTNN